MVQAFLIFILIKFINCGKTCKRTRHDAQNHHRTVLQIHAASGKSSHLKMASHSSQVQSVA
jgi:hypothetical protein